MPKSNAILEERSNAILEELRGIREQLRFIADQIRLILIYEVDPAVASLAQASSETTGRLNADDAFVQEQQRSVLRMPLKKH
jgi:hypothetical protein